MTSFHVFFTVLLFAVFIGIVLWAYSSRRKKDFEEAARLPFADEDKPSNNKGDQA